MLDSTKETDKLFKLLHLENGKGLIATLSKCLVTHSMLPDNLGNDLVMPLRTSKQERNGGKTAKL